ncbi:DNA polymerase-3 subunit epsilon [Paracoccus isoporae]|uniref:DNA-directed DNA polymerase n=1 Tax=Paracoccus isoporae TaxID=591205 RepID=A0A1G7BFJ1_9RHOB|nr:exonuclease domain-containing protein [Paracoccus isoporae]SDE25851.1 DNA polymerase-3 subunit epsilon [Paracoccus isoporae]
MRLPLRRRVLLIFAVLGAGVAMLVLAALGLAWRGLRAGEGSPAGLVDALSLIALIGGLGSLVLISCIWFLLDRHLARPVERLTGALLTGTGPDPQEARDLPELAQAVAGAAAARDRAARVLDAAMAAHAEADAQDKRLLEHLLSDIGAGAVMADGQGRVLFYNAAAAELLPGLALERPLERSLDGGGLAAARARLAAGAAATDLALSAADGTRLRGRMRALPGEMGGSVLILRPAQDRPAPPYAPIEALRRHAAALAPLLDDPGRTLPAPAQQAIRAAGQGIVTALRDLDRTLSDAPQDRPRVAAEELARGMGLPLGEVAPVTLAADGWQIGGLLAALGARLEESGRPPTAEIRAAQGEAVLSLRWQGAKLAVDELDRWLQDPPDPDTPDLSGAEILAAHDSAIWPEPQGDGFRLVLPLPLSEIPRAARPSVTYDFALAASGREDERDLRGLCCVVFDTETTGLSLSDRIVQIAGLRIAGGRLTGERFETLVHPCRAIPPGSTRYHGITDQMVADAPDMAAALRDFHAFAEDAVLIAHNAPFDMGLLRAAEAESGRHFSNPVMDTVLLSAMLWGQGATHSLDAICDRLGIVLPPERRHTAMGDAEATAQAYLRMLPALEARGITSFARMRREAQRHRRLLSDANLAAAHGPPPR